MAIDQALVGNMAAKLMEQLEESYGEDAAIKAACVIVAVDHEDQNTVHFDFGPALATYEGLGLLEQVRRNLGSG
ncbi:MAG TPA: hypothetical protein VNB59_03975 [Solirubrobacterales bacterium]|nr:hypothetical protein [Solirubrobacterales bacterium]